METKAVFQIQINENGEVAFTKLADGAVKFGQKAKQAKESAHELNGVFESLRNTMLGGFGAFEAISFGKESEDLYLNVKRADAEIQASLKSTNNAAGVTNEQLKEGAEGLYHHSEYAMDNIKRMQSVLLTFPKVAAGQFDEASQAIIDTAAKLGGKDANLQEMAVRIGKALQDPAHGMQMLAKEGVNFTKSQVKMVESLVAAGHQAEAQRYILHELETEFGGSAQAALTAGGAHEQMAKTVEELKTQTGQLVSELETDLVPVVSVVVEDIQSWIKWGEEHKGLIEGTVKVTAVLTATYLAFNTALKAGQVIQKGWIITQGVMKAATLEETAAVVGLTEAVEALEFSTGFGLIVAGLTAVVGGYELFKDRSDISSEINDADTLASKWDNVKGAIHNVNSELMLNQFLTAKKDYTVDSKSGMIKFGSDSNSDNQSQDVFNSLFGGAKNKRGPAKLRLVTDAEWDKYNGFNKAATGKGNLPSGPTTPSADSVKGSDKQVINTWNIKEFGKSVNNFNSSKEVATDIHDHMMRALTSAVNDSEIASGE